MGMTDGTTAGRHVGVDDVVSSIREASRPIATPQDERRMIYATGENLRHVRHDQLLERWPVLPEPWARRIEDARLAAVDRTPGAATFGR